MITAEDTLKAVESSVLEGSRDDHRNHLGGSIIGDECERKLWYVFRWAMKPQFPSRILRLFARGQREEDVFNDLLRKSGVTVWDVDADTNQQFSVSEVGGHFGGSLDGFLMGVPERPKEPMVSEQKTHGDKSFKDLQRRGVEVSKPIHWAQMQIYMFLTQDVSAALYQAVNKNDDSLHFEIVELDEEMGDRLLKKAHRIIASDRPSFRISEDSTFYLCKMCDFHALCHGTTTPEFNCRTCIHSTPVIEGEDGLWMCEFHDRSINQAAQINACDSHRFIPDLLQTWAEPIEVDEETHDISYLTIGNTAQKFTNGEGKGHYLSREIAAAEDYRAIGAEATDALKEMGELTG